MPSESSVSLANKDRKNLPNIAASLNLLMPEPIMGGLYKFAHKEQAYNMPVSHRYSQVQPVTTVNTSIFQSSANNYIDFNIPMNIDLIDETVLEIDLTNTDSTSGHDWVANASEPFWFDKIEHLDGTRILQTIRDVDMYLENTIYLDDFERAKRQPMIALDASSYKVNSTAGTVAAGSTATFRLPVNSVLTRCKLFLQALKKQQVLRFYPKSIASFSTSSYNSSITLSRAVLFVRDLQLTPDSRNLMHKIHMENVDYRIVDTVHDQQSIALTSGSVVKLKTTNFINQPYSHVVALTRANAPTGTALETFIQHNNIYFEDANNQNLSNGIQWSDGDNKQIVYQSHFPNTMVQKTDMHVYVPLVASSDPVKAFKTGVQNGYDVLPLNANLCINSASSATRLVDIICYAYRHVRVLNGDLQLI